MIVLVGSKIDQASIHASLGKPEYSYYFLMKDFLPALSGVGTVILVKTVAQIEALTAQYKGQGEAVVFFSFNPPQQTPLGLPCPTIPVFAWEFDSLPCVVWDDDPRNDWRFVFARTRAALATSGESAALVRAAMGDKFPVMALPAPIFSRFETVCPEEGLQPARGPRQFHFSGTVIDSPWIGFSADGLVSKPAPAVTPAESGVVTQDAAAMAATENADTREMSPRADESVAAVAHAPGMVSGFRARWRESARVSRALACDWWQEIRQPRYMPSAFDADPTIPVPADPAPVVPPPRQPIEVREVVYVTILNPADGRKNWVDILTAFCWAFKDIEDATLIVKMTHHDIEHYRIVLMTLLSRLAPFRCRVLVLHGFLDDADYLDLVKVSDYYVNASSAEGLCIPLMEFLSCGKPAIAPSHSAMADYLDAGMAFLLAHSREPTCWPHDPTGMLLTHSHRLNWQSLMEAFLASYRLAREAPQSYQAMSRHARERMQTHCAVDRVCAGLRALAGAARGESAQRSAAPMAQRAAS